MRSRRAGVALVVALSLMAFVLVLSLSLATLVRVEVSSASNSLAKAKAGENAKLGLYVALGRLQTSAGPDQRVTAQARIFDVDNTGTVNSPKWVGVWKSDLADWDSLGRAERIASADEWLVSGNYGMASGEGGYLTPLTDLSQYPQDDVVSMVSNEYASPAEEVRVMRESIPEPMEGHYAYWVSDESEKARVDLIEEVRAEIGDLNQHLAQTESFQVSQRAGVEFLEGLESYPANQGVISHLADLGSLIIELASSGLNATELKQIEDRYFDSLTNWSRGLLVDVKNGGLKRDLTQAFEYRSIFDANFVLDPSEDDLREMLYFIDDPVLRADGIDGIDRGGPNWSILRSYYRQYLPGVKRTSSSNQESRDGADAGVYDRYDTEDYDEMQSEGPDYFSPYKEYDDSKSEKLLFKYLGWAHNHPDHTFAPLVKTGLPYQTIPSTQGNNGPDRLHAPMSDNYQLQSWMTPIISRLQMSFSVNNGDEGLELIVTPVIGLYNPYNTEIKFYNKLRFGWAPNPVIAIEVFVAGVSRGTVRFGLREAFPPAADGSITYFIRNTSVANWNTDPYLTLKPGETRYFGVDVFNNSYYASSHPERVTEKGLALFWRDGSGTIEYNDNETDVVILSNYQPGAGGLVIPLKMRYEGVADWTHATEDGVTPIERYQSGYGDNRPSRQPNWGFTDDEYALLALLANGEESEDEPVVDPSFRISIEMTESVGAGLDLTEWYRLGATVQGNTKLFTDSNSSKEGAYTGQPVSKYYDSLAAASNQDSLLTVDYWLKTTTETNMPWRTLIDSNIRAIASNSEWDGFDEDNGYRILSTFTTSDPDERGLVSGNAADIHIYNYDRASGYWGDSVEASGESEVILFDRPRTPLLSLGALQHANLGRYNFDPTYMVGNSYANVRIPLNATSSEAHGAWIYHSDPADSPDYDQFKLFDTSYLVNEKLWDRYFFSGMTKDISEDAFDAFTSGSYALGNSRYHYNRLAGELNYADLSEREADDSLFHELAANLLIEGAFNVNSTSVPAWKAVLGGLVNSEIPIYSPDRGFTTEDGGIVASRFSWPYNGKVNLDESSGRVNFWKGVREISEAELEDLAEAVVEQVKQRGPFLSMSDFVNRQLTAGETGKSGALQAALDDPLLGLNTRSKIGGLSLDGPDSVSGAGFYDVFPETNLQAAGFPGYVLQGDLLQALGPILTVRGDTFLIRAYGDYTNPITGKVDAKAWCEAVVQRTVLPVDADIEAKPEELIRPVSELGRRYEIVSFRWLNEEEI